VGNISKLLRIQAKIHQKIKNQAKEVRKRNNKSIKYLKIVIQRIVVVIMYKLLKEIELLVNLKYFQQILDTNKITMILI